MDRNYCVIGFIVYMSYSDTWKVAKCRAHEKKIDVKKGGRGKQRHQMWFCPQVPVLCMKQCHRGLHGRVIEIWFLVSFRIFLFGQHESSNIEFNVGQRAKFCFQILTLGYMT